MHTVQSIAALQSIIKEARDQQQGIGFVPTMGNLHQGHLNLVNVAKAQCDFVVVSIYVNPLQFGANEDLDKYPRTLADDQAKLEALGVDALFTPDTAVIYPEGLAAHSKVTVPKLGDFHCGATRPGHFDGVTTIVNKLLNIVQADIAVFGEKDFQQLAIIKKMVNDLCMPTHIVSVPTTRADDGLALSSRNQYLDAQQRATAPLIYQTLKACQQSLQTTHELTPSALEQLRAESWKQLQAAGFMVDYLNIVDAKSLQPLRPETQSIVVLLAAYLGNTRLIDNICFNR